MQLLPKRPVLEKSNGAAASVFTPSMFHYQQALANMQLQQPAFIPAGEWHSCGDTALTPPSCLRLKSFRLSVVDFREPVSRCTMGDWILEKLILFFNKKKCILYVMIILKRNQ